MIYIKRFIIILLVAGMAGGCSNIDYDKRERMQLSSPQDSGDMAADESLQPANTEHQTLFYPVTRRGYSEKYQAETLTSYEYYSVYEGFEGLGYIRLDENMTADFELDVPATQHYSIAVSVRAKEEAVVALNVSGEAQGFYYIEPTPDNQSGFTTLRLDGIYLEIGVNRMSFTQLKGTVFIDFLTVNDFELPDAGMRFSVSRIPANENSAASVRRLLDYFGEIYGKQILLSQYVTPGTNTEIAALYTATGKLPAIRASDLMRYSRSFTGDRPVNDDVTLAAEWAQAGGIVSYDWTWTSPPIDGGESHYYAGASDINLNEAFTTSIIADLDTDRLFSLYEMKAVSLTCYELILEIDHIAEVLKPLSDAGIPVLWRPMHQAATRWFWWGNCEPEAYKWLWRLMFERLQGYHGINNLVWVWAGGSPEYYPGDDYVDIIGEDIYNMDSASNAPAYYKTDDYTRRRKFTALTETGLLPLPDLLARDGVMWLWTSLYRGDYLIDGRGRITSHYNRVDRLERTYNHELTITLDKLPKDY